MTRQEQKEMVDVMTASNNPFIDISTEQMSKVAEALYNAGWRKVLLDTENGYAVDVVQYAPWQLIKGHTEREVARTRKETAKEILQNWYDENKAKGDEQGYVIELAEKYGVEVEE